MTGTRRLTPYLLPARSESSGDIPERGPVDETRCHEIDSGNDLQVFEPKEFKGGRVKVYGCSPGCLLVSIVLSVFLTLTVNGCLHLVG
jgi:hypothetical protein